MNHDLFSIVLGDFRFLLLLLSIANEAKRFYAKNQDLPNEDGLGWGRPSKHVIKNQFQTSILQFFCCPNSDENILSCCLHCLAVCAFYGRAWEYSKNFTWKIWLSGVFYAPKRSINQLFAFDVLETEVFFKNWPVVIKRVFNIFFESFWFEILIDDLMIKRPFWPHTHTRARMFEQKCWCNPLKQI